MSSLYSVAAKTIKGKDFDFQQLKGKTVLIVNTASKCGLTPQFKGLEELHQKFKDRGLVILGFPCNQFMKQEPGTSEEIGEFCTLNYGVTFQMMDKIDVNGPKTHPLYHWLKETKKVPCINWHLRYTVGNGIHWNFEKFLIDKNGEIVERFLPPTTPQTMEPTIEKIL